MDRGKPFLGCRLIEITFGPSLVVIFVKLLLQIIEKHIAVIVESVKRFYLKVVGAIWFVESKDHVNVGGSAKPVDHNLPKCVRIVIVRWWEWKQSGICESLVHVSSVSVG